MWKNYAESAGKMWELCFWNTKIPLHFLRLFTGTAYYNRTNILRTGWIRGIFHYDILTKRITQHPILRHFAPVHLSGNKT